jgi:hypothetical protein
MEYLPMIVTILVTSFLTSFMHNLNKFKRVKNFTPVEKKSMEISVTPIGDDCGYPTRVHIEVHSQKLDITMNQFNELKNLIAKI